jgi:hypothetical protein
MKKNSNNCGTNSRLKTGKPGILAVESVSAVTWTLNNMMTLCCSLLKQEQQVFRCLGKNPHNVAAAHIEIE